jgi:hypothetical protein
MASVSTILRDQVTFRVSCADRIFLHGWLPGLVTEGHVIRFLLHRGAKQPSPHALGWIRERMTDEIAAFAEREGIPVVTFAKGASKEGEAAPYLAAAESAGREGVVMIGVSQERVPGGWRGYRTNRGSDEYPHFHYVRTALYVNLYYFYIWDRRFGPGFLRLCPYAPFGVHAWVNGHEWLKRQLASEGIAFTALDNGLASCADPARAQELADSFSAGHVLGWLGRWTSRVPCALDGKDRAAGYRYEWSVRQAEFSDTMVFARPQAGRAWFEAAIREHLDLGRPEKVSLIVDRRITRRTPGRFRTEVITEDVDPQVQCWYKTSKTKAYFKEHRALRVETTVNNPRDFDVRTPLNRQNWKDLRAVARGVNARFLAALGEGALEPPDVTALQEVVLPSEHDGLRAPGLRFGDPRVMALLSAICAFAHALGGLTNAGLTRMVAAQLGVPYTSRQATYDLRRLRRKGFIERVPGRNLYRVTERGRQIATLFTKTESRVLVPVLTALEEPAVPRSPAGLEVINAWRHYEKELGLLIEAAGLTA